MQEIIVHEVAGTPLHLDPNPGEFGELFADNDESYREYLRLLRNFSRMAWQWHDCSYCREGIHAGEWYSCEIWVEKKLNEKPHFFVTKRHDPVCPKDLRDMEEEMEREFEREDQKGEKKAA